MKKHQPPSQPPPEATPPNLASAKVGKLIVQHRQESEACAGSSYTIAAIKAGGKTVVYIRCDRCGERKLLPEE